MSPGVYVCHIGVSYVADTLLGFAVRAVYAGILLNSLLATTIVVRGFRGRKRVARATDMMAARGSGSAEAGGN